MQNHDLSPEIFGIQAIEHLIRWHKINILQEALAVYYALLLP